MNVEPIPLRVEVVEHRDSVGAQTVLPIGQGGE